MLEIDADTFRQGMKDAKPILIQGMLMFHIVPSILLMHNQRECHLTHGEYLLL
jgi:hypothetical protein